MSFANIFKISYYFDSSVGYTFTGFWVVVGILFLILVVSIFGSIKLGKNKKDSQRKKFLLSSWVNIGYLFSILGLFLLFFRYQGIAYLNWRFWIDILLLVIIVWGGYLIYYQKKILPKKNAEKDIKISQQYYFKRRRKK